MAAEASPKTPATPAKSLEGGHSNNLFYAYARRSDYAQFSPYLLTFVNADIAKQWWDVVKQEYPESTREGTQLFTFKGDDIPGQIWDNPRFEHLKNKWFYSHFGDMSGTGGIIPLQDENGHLLGQSGSIPNGGNLNLLKSPTGISDADGQEQKPFDLSSLSTTLDRMQSMIEENTNQIKALSVAQSEGLQRMQDINESNAGQIKSLAEGQSKLQSMMDQNASQYIALTNSQFANQETIKTVLAQNAEQVKALAQSQIQLAATCKEMMGSVSQLTQSPASSVNGAGANFIPPPRKLERRVKGYQYVEDVVKPSSPRNSITVPVGGTSTPKKVHFDGK